MKAGTNLKKLYLSEQSRLKKLLDYSDDILAESHDDGIHAHRKGKYISYTYFSTDEAGNRSEKYLKKEELESYKEQIAVQCAKKVKPVLSKLISALSDDMESFDDKALDSVFFSLWELYGDNMPKEYFPNSVLLENWQTANYVKLAYKEEDLQFSTLRGEKVRSKVEVMVADILYDMKIPYRYDARLVKGGMTFWPDYTLVSPVSGDIYYLEVFGMMTDNKYAVDNIKKINDYQSAGIIQGDKLITVFDSEEVPLDAEALRKTLRTLVLDERN